MKGFMDCTQAIIKVSEQKNSNYDYEKGNADDVMKRQQEMIDSGLFVDEKNRIFVMNGFGAFKYNIDKSITTINELLNFKLPNTNIAPYKEINGLIDEGYQFIIGPAAPASRQEYMNGLYCSNYLDIIAKENQNIKTK